MSVVSQFTFGISRSSCGSLLIAGPFAAVLAFLQVILYARLLIFHRHVCICAARRRRLQAAHVVSLGNATPVKLLVGPSESKSIDITMRPLYVDGKVKELYHGRHPRCDRPRIRGAGAPIASTTPCPTIPQDAQMALAARRLDAGGPRLRQGSPLSSCLTSILFTPMSAGIATMPPTAASHPLGSGRYRGHRNRQQESRFSARNWEKPSWPIRSTAIASPPIGNASRRV